MLTPQATLPSGIVFNAEKEFLHVVNIACALASSGLYMKQSVSKGVAPTFILAKPGVDDAVCGVALVDHTFKIYMSLKIDFEHHIKSIQTVIQEEKDKRIADTANN